MKTISRLFWKLFHVNKSLLVMYLEMSNNLSFFFFLRCYSSKFRFTEWKSEFPGLQNGNQNFPVYRMEIRISRFMESKSEFPGLRNGKKENFQFSFLYLEKKSSFHSRKRKISSFHYSGIIPECHFMKTFRGLFHLQNDYFFAGKMKFWNVSSNHYKNAWTIENIKFY